MKRNEFIQKSLTAGLLLGANAFPFDAFAQRGIKKLTILHTNDQHSRIEPFPMDGGKHQGLGGFAQRATIINNIRQQEKNVLLLDSGDIWQGTPYFNMFGGEVEYKLMNEMRYDAVTLGNHDFDSGIEGLAKYMPTANFSFLSANYDFSNTAIHQHVKPYKIFSLDGIKVGVFGLGIELKGLVPTDLYGDTQYLDPIQTANKTAAHLKDDLKCDLVICLSHLGYSYEDKKVSDVVLANISNNIDLILGGHTHTFMKQPDEIVNEKGQKVLVNQVGWAGIQLGRIDFNFESKKKIVSSANLPMLVKKS